MAKEKITITPDEFVKKSADAAADMITNSECGIDSAAGQALNAVSQELFARALCKLFEMEEEDETAEEVDKAE